MIVIFIFSIGCLIYSKFCEVSWNSFSNRLWKFHLSVLKNRKVLFLKEKFLSHCQYQNKKVLFTDQTFSEGFDWMLVQKAIDFVLRACGTVHNYSLLAQSSAQASTAIHEIIVHGVTSPILKIRIINAFRPIHLYLIFEKSRVINQVRWTGFLTCKNQ